MSSFQAKAAINLPFGGFKGDLAGMENIGNLFGPRAPLAPEAKQ